MHLKKRYRTHRFAIRAISVFRVKFNVEFTCQAVKFSTDLLNWWSKFREDNANDNDWYYVVWNDKDVRADNKPIFYKKLDNHSIKAVDDLRFDLSNTSSYELIASKIRKTNF